MLRSLLLVLLVVSVAAADDFPVPINTEPLSEDHWLSPEAAAAGFDLPEGFQAVSFAAEPDVQNPIAMAWDGRGRLWIAENYTYAERAERFQLNLRDRVIILDNTTGGKFQTRKVFTDDVQMLTSVEVGHGGVWLMCPPKLIFMPDRDGDDVPDNAGEVVLDGFTVAKQNYHNFANGLRFGPDGWLYGRCGGSCPGRIGAPGTPDDHRLALEGGIWRYHPIDRTVEVLTTGTTNPWGHDWNSVGEAFFTNTVNGHLWHMIPGAHFTRPFTLDPNRHTYELIDFHADHWHFDTGQGWTKSRDGTANSFGGGHAHCGAMIYQGTTWPEQYQDKLFTLNLHGLRANLERLERDGGGYVARHEPDFFVAADPWFRGMDLSIGPDGNVFVIDWSDTGECHESTGVHRTSGRVFKIVRTSSVAERGINIASRRETPQDITQCSIQRLIDLATSTEAWSFRQARLELARRRHAGDDIRAASVALRQSFETKSATSADYIRTLMAMHSAGATDGEFLVDQWNHPDEHVRAWAIRLLTEDLKIDDALGPAKVAQDQQTRTQRKAARLLPQLKRVAQEDTSALVRLTLASTLQRLPVSQRAELAKVLAAHAQDADDHNLPLMLWYGLMAVGVENPSALVDVARSCQIPTTLRLISRFLAAQVNKNPDLLDALIGVAADSHEQALRFAIVQGIDQGWAGWQSVHKPKSWDRLVGKENLAETTALIQRLGPLFGDGRSIKEVTDIALGSTDAPYTIRLAALDTLIQIKAETLRSTCQTLLSDARMNVLAARGLSTFDDPSIGKALVDRYRSIRAPYQPQVMSILVSRPTFASQMLTAISENKIARDDLSAFHVRQIQQFGIPELNQQLRSVWGEVRDSPAEKQASMRSWKTKLTAEKLAQANKANGRRLFVKHCQTCHRMYGQGETVGPDLTGGNRTNLDYLLQNIIDPSAVVDKDFRMTSLLTSDGRLITGLVTGETEQTVTIRTSTEALVLDTASIENRQLTEKSPMPDGLIDHLSDDQVGDLLAYLQHPTQISLVE